MQAETKYNITPIGVYRSNGQGCDSNRLLCFHTRINYNPNPFENCPAGEALKHFIFKTLTMLHKIRTHWNRTEADSPKEKNVSPSMTVPDQTMSVKEIMDRYARGLPLGGQKVPIYEGEDFVPDLKNMDLADRQTLFEQAKEELADIKERLNQKQRQKQVLTLTADEIKALKEQARPKEEPKNPTNIS